MFTKKELEYMNSTKIWRNTIEIIEKETIDNDSYTIYKVKDEDSYLALPMKLFITNEIAEKLENKLMQELHNNRVKVNANL
tara:strand:- start:410 stop:652 length:243 start_codon:yes stop_codon:yes gene_type:complete